MTPETTSDIKRRLELLFPYILSSEKLIWRPFYVTYKLYTYSRDILTAVVGLGVVSPVFKLLASALSGEKVTGESAQSLSRDLPALWFVVVLAAAIISAVMRVYVTTEQVEKRAVLAKSCRREFRGLSSRLYFALQTENPKSEIIDIQNEVTQTVRRYIGEDAWPWQGVAPGTEAAGRVRAQNAYDAYGDRWTQAAEIEARED